MLKRLFRFVVKTSIWFVLLSVLWVLLYRFIDVPFTPLMGIRSFQAQDSYEIRHTWTDLEDISEEIKLAVICAEDQNFIQHNGFDLKAIEKAYKDNKSGKNLKGGSTISQQTAKNVFLWPKRSWIRKGMETYFTFLIENLWSKERILEVYLNSIEMGEGVFGVESAAQYWFQKNAKQLNRHESAALAVILPNPRKYNPAVRTPYLERRKQWVLKQMNNFGELSLAEK
ncbi:MAG: monofunctional biosynthetic peptidoglycan transglycosylase [Flavobacteriaceae bacterium]|nr:monofunctional biosynthetic peptidoglycan transglycosylase [Flavobacteriaceae bacterium]